MSTSAPWLAISVDWQDSAMFDGANHGVRLAWICLLCHAKACGRGGTVRVRKAAFCAAYRITPEAFDELLSRATANRSAQGERLEPAVSMQGDMLTFTKWSAYQGKASQAAHREKTALSDQEGGSGYVSGKRKKSNQPSTHHQAQEPSTKDTLAAGKPPRTRTARDDLFDAVSIGAYGVSPPPNGQAARIGKIVTALVELGATPDEFRRRFENAKTHFDHPGPEAVVKHWAVCDASATARAAPAKVNRRDTEYEQERKPIKTIAL